MTRRLRSPVSLAFLLLLGLFVAPGRPAQDEALVVAVIDGDTIRVRLASGDVERVRLIGIDSPELDDRREPVRFMAFMARKFADLRLYRRTVRLEHDWEPRDKYGRLLAYVRTADGDLFNETIVREGFAYAMTAFPFREDYRRRFLAAQTDAREQGRGLWRKEPYPVLPSSEAAAHAGEIVTVRFRCAEAVVRRRLRILRAGDGFEAVASGREAAEFDGIESLRGRTVDATGLAEALGRTARVSLYVPSQLRERPGPGRTAGAGSGT